MIYNLGIQLYSAGVAIASVSNPKARKMRRGHREMWDILRQKVASQPGRWVWIHAASLGEFEQGRPLIDRIKARRPELKVLLTFFSPSGYEIRRDYPGADAVCYLPFDTPANARRLVGLVRPVAAVFVKYEFWRNYLRELSRAGVPTYLISAIFRPSQPFFRPWGGLFRRMLGCFTRLFVQDERSRQLLASIGVENVTVAGDTRFDRVTDIMASRRSVPEIDRFCSDKSPVIVVGSSWPADEAVLTPWLREHSEVKSIFAPHEFDASRLERLKQQLGEGTELLSVLQARPDIDPASLRHIIIDSFGLLASVYAKATMAYVGGGFGAGIHNLNEAAVYATPVIFGPRHQKFKEAADLIACGGGFSIASASEFAAVANRLLGSPECLKAASEAAGAYIRSSLGATDIVFNQILPKND